MDLSSPHGSSINGFIPKDDYTLHYASFDEALTLVARYRQKVVMAKLDNKHAFRLCPVRLGDRELLGIHWQGKFYIDLHLPFGLRSSPYLFNRLVDAFEWLLKNNYRIQDLIHYLDDYFTVGPAHFSVCAHNVKICRYSTFCASMRWQSFPATETTLRFFAAYLADQVSFKTIKLPDPFQETPLLHLLSHGIKHTVGLSLRQRLPITMTLLWQIKEELARALDLIPSNKLMLWSAFTLAFYGFLHSSEFTSPSTTRFNPLVHLCFTDVSFTSEGCLTLHLKSSKTDPYRQGCSLLIAPSLHSVCAVWALRKYLSLHSVSGASPLYIFQSGAYLTRAKVTLTLCNLNVSVFLQSSMHLTASESVLPLQQLKLVCHLGSSKHWDAGQVTASPYISEVHLLSFRRFLGCWQHHTLQDKGYATRYQDIAPVVFHNCLVMPAVFEMFFLGAYLPLSLACSRLGGALTPP